jgi:hypothetical protein
MKKRKYDFDFVKLDYVFDSIEYGQGFVVKWGCIGYGYGELTFYKDAKNHLVCETECMSRYFVQAVMRELIKRTIMLDK